MRASPCRRRRSDPAVETAVAEHGRGASVALPVLQSVQAATGGFLENNVLGAAADALQVHDARIYGIASFYSLLSTRPRAARVIRVCDGPVCMLRGAAATRVAVEAVASGSGWTVERCSCLGLCDRAPAALVNTEPCGPIATESLGDILRGGWGNAPSYVVTRAGEVRVALARIGCIDPDSIDSAIAAGAYQTLTAALAEDHSQVLDMVDRSGLRGRGGAGFPTGRKWRMAEQADGPQKYVVCNADESEPGTFKDRVLMEGDPHLLLERLALAGYAVGAGVGVIYIRGEYEWVARRLERAVAQAEERGWLGANNHGSQFSFRIHIHRGAGAYICGEETALLESLEGKRGEPRVRPPYPTTCGLHGQPTVVNNVETLCLVPAIVARGADWFRTLGTAHSPGTKVFTVSGCVNRPGAFEAPLGVTLRQIVEQFGGGLRDGSKFKAALTGGAAGTIVHAALLDVPLDFASGKQRGERLQWPVPNASHPGVPILHVGRFTRGLGRFHAVDHLPAAELPDPEYPLVLTTGRVLYHWHGGEMSRRARGLLEAYPETLVEISIEDAAKLGLNGRKSVRVRSRRGEVVARAVLTDRVALGVVFGNFHFPGPHNINNLTSGALDPVAKIPEYKVCAVAVEAVDGE